MATPRDDLAAVRLLVSDLPPADDDQPALAGWLQRLCRAAVRHLPAMGVGVSLVNDEGVLITLAASDVTSSAIEELQFTLGEGPCLAAYDARGPVLVPDLTTAPALSWPAYAAAAQEQGVRAVFAFPLQIGVMRLGALDVYRQKTGGLSPSALSRALAFAEVATEGLLGVGGSTEESEDFFDDIAGSGYRVYQAQGMVMIQLGVSSQEALLRLRAYAFSHERRLSQVAEDVVHRRLVLEPDNSEGQGGGDDFDRA